MLADWKSRDLTQEDCADLAAYGNIPSTDNLPLVSGNQVVNMFIFSYLRMAAYRQIDSIRKKETLLLFPKFGRLIKAATIKGRAQKNMEFFNGICHEEGVPLTFFFFNFSFA